MKLTKKANKIIAATLLAATLAGCGAHAAQGAQGAGNSSSTAEQSTESQSTESQGTESQSTESQSTADENKFPTFTGKDFEGNQVDNSLFEKNAVTVLNFWFNGCSACVGEMTALETMNGELKKKGAELVGVNVEAGEGENSLAEAKKILEEQKATYRNIMMDEGKEASKFLDGVQAFPTTLLVDRNGRIVGKPIVGNIDGEARMAEIMKQIDEIIEADKKGEQVKSDASDNGQNNEEAAQDEGNTASGKDADFNALLEKENDIISAHVDIWNKMFELIPQDEGTYKGENGQSYDDFLREKLNSVKNSLKEDEIKTLQKDIEKIAEIERQMDELLK